MISLRERYPKTIGKSSRWPGRAHRKPVFPDFPQNLQVGLGIKNEKTCSKPDYLNQDVIEGKAIAGEAEWLVRWAPIEALLAHVQRYFPVEKEFL